jgi:hypothetical protein
MADAHSSATTRNLCRMGRLAREAHRPGLALLLLEASGPLVVVVVVVVVVATRGSGGMWERLCHQRRSS